MKIREDQRPFADLVQIVCPAEGGDEGSFGSGLLVRPGIVLTALHCVGVAEDGRWRGRSGIEVRLWRDLLGESLPPLYVGEIRWPDLPGRAEDIAVLWLTSRDEADPPQPFKYARYCKLPEEGENVPAAARGFPAVAKGNKGVIGERGEVNLGGTVSRFSSSGMPTARYKSTSEAETENARMNTWMGLSGGPLLCNGAVAGVMRSVPKGWNGKSDLDVTPLSHLVNEDAAFTPQGDRLRRLLDITADLTPAHQQEFEFVAPDGAGIESRAWFTDEFRRRVADATGELLPNKLPLVDREYLRERVREFLDPARGPGRILVVPSSKAAGKSHSQHLFRHTAHMLDLCFVFIDCLKERCGVEVAQKIANEIGLSSGYEELKKQMHDASRPGMVFKSWLKGRLPAPRRAWIVFDHVVKPKSATEVESIALELAEAAALGEFETIYITLIDSEYEPEIAGFAGLGPLCRDNPVAPLSPDDIAAFIVRWAEKKHKPLGEDDAEMEAKGAFQDLTLPLSRETTGKLIQFVGVRLEKLGLLR